VSAEDVGMLIAMGMLVVCAVMCAVMPFLIGVMIYVDVMR
jgi:hypothetical protein